MQILRAKYGATRFRNMNDEQIDLWGDAMLLKIAVITGWTLPTDALQNILVDQFKKKMLESYADCNPEEIEYAFRNYGCQMKDWGKQLNLALIDEVIQPYLRKRREQSVVEEHAAPPLLLSSKKEAMSDFSMLRWLAQEIRFIKTGKPFELVPPALYDYLDKRGKIKVTNAEKYGYLQKAAAWRLGQLQKEVERKGSVDNLRALENFKSMKEKDNFSLEEFEQLKTIAKKLLFFDLVQNN
jgi:hypothetical protein